jgi:hypothetical protein
MENVGDGGGGSCGLLVNLQKSSPFDADLEVAVPPGVTFECSTVALSR